MKFFSSFSVNLLYILVFINYTIIGMCPAQERFFIGIRIPVGLVKLDGVKNYVDQKIQQHVSTRYNPVTFTPEQWLHITIAEGTIDQAAKIKVDQYLKQISSGPNGWKKFKIRYKKGGEILGMLPHQKFVVLLVDDSRPHKIISFANTIRNYLIKMQNNNEGITVYHSNLPLKLHTSIGKIHPSYDVLNPVQQQNIQKIIHSLDPHDLIKAPIAADSLKNFKVKEFKFVVTPSNEFLTSAELISPKYIYGTYHAQ